PESSPTSPLYALPPIFASPLSFFFFNDTATTEIYTLSLHDALPIYEIAPAFRPAAVAALQYSMEGDIGEVRGVQPRHGRLGQPGDRKSTRLNSSHVKISYAVFCLKKKKKKQTKDKQKNNRKKDKP